MGFQMPNLLRIYLKRNMGETPHSFRDKSRQKQVDVVENYQLESSETFLGSPEILMKLGDFIRQKEKIQNPILEKLVLKN